MPERRLRRHRAPLYPERTLDLLVSEVPEVKSHNIAVQL
jgi:hypothetical protein